MVSLVCGVMVTVLLALGIASFAFPGLLSQAQESASLLLTQPYGNHRARPDLQRVPGFSNCKFIGITNYEQASREL